MKIRHFTRLGILFATALFTLSACGDNDSDEERCTEASCGENQQCNDETGKCEDIQDNKTCKSDEDCDGKTCKSGECVESEQPADHCESDADCNGKTCKSGECVEIVNPGDHCESNDDCGELVCDGSECVECMTLFVLPGLLFW